MNTTTAHTPRGHRAWLGTGCRHQRGQPQKHGHRAAIGPRSTFARRDDLVAAALQQERLRQALYESCERAPEFTSAHRNLVGE